MQPASALLIALTVCGLNGCAAREPVTPAPLILNLPDCPAPEAPALPPLDGTLAFDSPENVAVIMERDDILRRYVDGLRAALRCYNTRAAKEHHESERP